MDEGEEEVYAGPLAVVSGRVVDAAGRPCPEAAVLAFEEGPRQFTGLRWIGLARAGAEGEYTLEVSPGPCLLVPFRPLEASPHPDDEAALRGTRIAPREGPFPDPVELRLPLSAAATGTVIAVVRESGGDPIRGASVSVDGISPSSGARQIQRTNQAGSVEFHGLLPGTRSLVVSGNRRQEPAYGTVELEEGGTREIAILALPRERPGSLSIRLRCEDIQGAGLEGVTLSLSGDDDFGEEVVTGPGGEVEVTGLPEYLAESHFSFHAFHRGFRPAGESVQHPFQEWPSRMVLRLEALAERKPREFRPLARRRAGAEPPSPGAAVSGVVRDSAGAPVEGASVRWARDEGQGLPDELSPLLHNVATTNALGRFAACGLPPGPALLTVEGRFPLGAAAPGQPQPVREAMLAEGTNGDVDFVLPYAISDIAEVRCRVVDGSERPRKGVSVTGDRCVGFLGRGGYAGSDSEGLITLQMFPGLNDVHAWETETHEGVHQVVEVEARGRHSVELVTPERSGQWPLALSVSVVDENGDRVPGAEVHLSNMEGGVGEGSTDDRGVCVFPRLHEGLQREELHVSAYAAGFCIGGEGAMVTAWPEGRPAEALVTLHRPVKIHLTVTEEGTGAYIPGCRLYVADRWSRGPRDYPEWGHEKGLEVDVMPGPVRLAASAPGYSMAATDVEVRREDPPPHFEFRLKRQQP